MDGSYSRPSPDKWVEPDVRRKEFGDGPGKKATVYVPVKPVCASENGTVSLLSG